MLSVFIVALTKCRRLLMTANVKHWCLINILLEKVTLREDNHIATIPCGKPLQNQIK